MTTSLPAIPDPPPDDTRTLVLAWLAGKRSVHTRRAYARDVAAWLRWLGDADPLDATETDAATWARHLDTAGQAPATVARKLSSASSWYAWLARGGHVYANPFGDLGRPAVDADTSSTPGLTRDQALAMLAAADKARGGQQARTAALVAVMLFTGARVSELTGADIEDLGTDRGHRVLRVTRKGGKRQALALPGPAAERLDAYLAIRGDMASLPAVPGEEGYRPRRPLFATETGGRLFAPDVWALVRRIGKAAGLPADLVAHMGAHSMRHSFATLYLDSGGSLRDLQDAMGHADPRTTRRYDRARYTLDRAPGYALAAYLSDSTT
jgi:site-specific recombinase XerD